MNDTTRFPQGWRVLAVPSNWDPTAKQLNIHPVTINYVTVPADFFMTIQTPEMIALDEPTAIVVSFSATVSGGVKVKRIQGFGPDWVDYLGEVTQVVPPAEWAKQGERLVVEFLMSSGVREAAGETIGQLPRWQVVEGPTTPTVGGGVQRRRKITRAHLEEVTKVYSSAQQQGDPPTRTVSDHFAVSHSTAAKWVGAARSVGLLPPVDGGSG